MLFNLRFALRQLSKTPGFAFVAIATLAVGIGACTAMFSVINAVLLKPLPFHEPDRLVWIENSQGQDLSGRTTRSDVFLGWREQNKSFESLAAYFAFYDYMRLTLTGVGEPQRLRGVAVTENFLSTLGVPLLYGRNFTAADCHFNTPPVVIVTNAYWRAHFNADPAVVGRVISLNNAPATIIGVLPATFDFEAIFSPGAEIGFLQPFPLTETANWGNTLFGIGRLRPGVTVAQAQGDLAASSTRLAKALAAKTAGAGSFGAVVRPLDGALRGKFRKPFLILVGAVACILLIACVNLSNLLLSRLNVRRQEFAVRIAVGARPSHLVAQTLTESLLLAVGGSLLGIPFAVWTTAALSRLQTFGIPLLNGAAVDPTALAVSIGLILFAGAACGIIPALWLAFGQGGAGPGANQQRSASRGEGRLRDGLIVGEIALACILLIGAGLLLRSFDTLLQVNLGFQPQHAMAWRIDPPRSFKTPVEADHYVADAVARVAALPGVEAVGVSDTLPLGRNRTWGAAEVGVQYPNNNAPAALPRMVDAGYLRAMQIPLLEGRYFDERDSRPGVQTIIINQSLARQLASHGSALGKKIAVSQDGSTVIGVVGDVRHSTLEERGTNEMYLDINQNSDWNGLEMVVRSSRPMASLAPEIRAALAAYDPMMPTGEYYELEKLIDDAVAPRRLITRLLGVFSVLALTLAALGLYGVIAFSVGQRTQEIGIRMAIGAQAGDVLQLILRSGLRLIALGVAIGVIVALVAGRLLEEMLYGVSAHDPLIFAANAALITLVGVGACVLPAFRASRVQPVVALRAG